MRKMIICLLGLLWLALPGYATVYSCNSVSDIRNAMAAANAGDEIVIDAGTYTASGVAVSGSSAYYYGSKNGTASNPITIRSASSSNRATLRGNDINSLTVLRIEGAYWVVKDLIITNGQKGLVFDNANHGHAINCAVHGTGNEAIHVRDGSDYVTIENCSVYNTGNDNAGFGEGIYIGTDKGSWSSYDPSVDYTTVKNCTLGPNIRAEAFDIKEGTTETVVEGCTVDATGLSGSNFADSFIDLKGTRSYIRCNTFNRNGNSVLTKGIAVIDRGVSLSSYDHAVHGNTFNMDIAGGNIFEAYSGTSGTYGWDNTRTPSGDTYNSRITASCCPSWYSSPVSCGGGGGGTPTCNAPGGRSTSGVSSTSVTFNWSGASGATNYDLRYRVNGTTTWTTRSNLGGTSYTQSGLTASTTYQWEIRSSCGSSNSSWASGSNVTTTSGGGGGGGGGSTLPIYDDNLGSGWSEFSYNGTYSISHTGTVQVGSKSVKADYTSYGGFFLKRSSALSLATYSQLRFWVKSDGSHNMRVKMDTNVGTKTKTFTTTGSWQQITMNLSDFGNPSSVTEFRLENRSSSSFTTYYDQVEFVGGSGSRLAEGSELRCYPNPTQGLLVIERAGASTLDLQLMTLTGALIRQEQVSASSLKLDLSGLPAGIYLLRVNGETRKLIKQ